VSVSTKRCYWSIVRQTNRKCQQRQRSRCVGRVTDRHGDDRRGADGGGAGGDCDRHARIRVLNSRRSTKLEVHYLRRKIRPPITHFLCLSLLKSVLALLASVALVVIAGSRANGSFVAFGIGIDDRCHRFMKRHLHRAYFAPPMCKGDQSAVAQLLALVPRSTNRVVIAGSWPLIADASQSAVVGTGERSSGLYCTCRAVSRCASTVQSLAFRQA
jgi:hypothetical protein